MKNSKFTGVMPAIFSVYDENRNVIKDTVNKMVKYHLDNGMDGFYVCGNTGECVVLPNKTRKQMLETVIEANNKKGTVIAHVGSGHIDDVYDLIDHANNMDIDAIASLPPSLTNYYEMSEIVEYYKIIAKKSKHPVFCYIKPGMSGDFYGFAEQLSRIDNVVGIKMSIPDYFTFGRIKTIDDGKLCLINGPDETMICGLIEGADGAIGTTYNMLPKLAKSIYTEFKNCNNQKALENQRKMNKVINVLIDANIAEWKASMTLMGYDMGVTIEPQRMPTKEYLNNLKKQLEEVDFFDLF